MTKFQKITRGRIDAGQPRRLRVAADRIELRAEAGAAHDELGGEGADRDEQDEVGDALPARRSRCAMTAATIAGASSARSRSPAAHLSVTPSARARRISASRKQRVDERAPAMIAAIDSAGGRKPVAKPVSERGSGATVAPLVAIIEMPRK